MKKKGKRRSSVAELLETPLPKAASSPPSNESAKSDIFNSCKKTLSASKIKKEKSLPTSLSSLSSVSDLKDLASSRLDDLKRHIDRSHAEILKELASSQSRLHKRFKIQTQSCQQLVDESEKEYKKVSERISESREAMKATYAEFIADAQASASRLRKTSMNELSQTCEKALDVLQSRYGIPST